MNKQQETINLSESILTDIELGGNDLESIIYKTIRLARLLDDIKAMKRLNLEISGYDSKQILVWYEEKDFAEIAFEHSRGTLVEWVRKYWTSSISELENNIKIDEILMTSLKAPDHYAPAEKKTARWEEKFSQILDKVVSEQRSIKMRLSGNVLILKNIKKEVYNYALTRNHELKYIDIVNDILQNASNNLIKKLSSSPNLNDILNSITSQIKSENVNDRSNAVHNCRRLLKEVADQIYPATTKKIIKGKKEISLWVEQYINRLIAYIETKTTSEKYQSVVGSHLDYIWHRLDSLNEAWSKWTHTKITEKQEAERYVILTYLLVSDMLSL